MRMRTLISLFSSALLWGCAADTTATPDGVAADSEGSTHTDAVDPSCAYPDGAVDPMAVGEVISPYRWPRAIHADGRDQPLDLAHVPCNTDPDIDWSPFDMLVFVSIPAW